jgi:hypothetical protein
MLPKASRRLLATAARALGADVAAAVDARTTHLVTRLQPARDGRAAAIAPRTFKYLLALSQGLWIVDEAWIRASLDEGCWTDPRRFEARGDSQSARLGAADVPRRSRRARERGRRGLFGRVAVSFHGPFSGGMTEPQLAQLVGAGGWKTSDDMSDAGRGEGRGGACELRPPAAACGGEEDGRAAPRVVVADPKTCSTDLARRIEERLGARVVARDWVPDSLSAHELQRPADYGTRSAHWGARGPAVGGAPADGD